MLFVFFCSVVMLKMPSINWSTITIGLFLFYLQLLLSSMYVLWDEMILMKIFGYWRVNLSMINNSIHREKKKKNDSLSAGDAVYRHISCSFAYDTYAFHFCYHLTNCDCLLTKRHFFFDCTQTKIDTVIDVVILTYKKKTRQKKNNVYQNNSMTYFFLLILLTIEIFFKFYLVSFEIKNCNILSRSLFLNSCN